MKCRNVTSLQFEKIVHRLLGIKLVESITKNNSEWIGFLLFNILDHICTTDFVFANLLEIYLKTFVNSQRHRNMIARSILGFEIPPPVSNAFPLTI
jgi:hypothetical protein